MLISAAYSVSGIRSYFSCVKVNKSSELIFFFSEPVEICKNKRECERKVRQSSCLHNVHQISGNLLPRDLSETSGLQRFQYCI